MTLPLNKVITVASLATWVLGSIHALDETATESDNDTLLDKELERKAETHKYRPQRGPQHY